MVCAEVYSEAQALKSTEELAGSTRPVFSFSCPPFPVAFGLCWGGAVIYQGLLDGHMDVFVRK